jgi:toxin ParE1/3/4
MEHSFALLADFPRIGAEVFHLAPLQRRYRYESHYIFYTEEDYGVMIRDLFHVAQDIRPSLFR